MQLRILLISLSIIIFSCNNKQEEKKDAVVKLEKFDSVKWSEKADGDYLYRNDMLKDFMTNYEWHGVKGDSILQVLGQPDRTDSLFLFYHIRRKKLAGITMNLKALVIKLKKDSTVEWLKIHE